MHIVLRFMMKGDMLSTKIKIAVLWRQCRNVELHEDFTGETLDDDAMNEALNHCKSLKEAGFSAEIVEWQPQKPELTLQEINKIQPKLVFNASSDEEVCFCETFNIPYAGSGINLVPLNKATRKKIWAYEQIPTPKFITISAHATKQKVQGLLNKQDLNFPLFIKPVDGRGSSGITKNSIVNNETELLQVSKRIIRTLNQPALVEKYIKGREISVGIIGNEDDIMVLPLLEIGYTGTQTNTYAHKMNDKEKLKCPAPLSKQQEQRIKTLAVCAYQALDARDYGRIDLMLKGDKPYFLELNTFAGLASPSDNQSEQDSEIHLSYMSKMAASFGKPQSWLIGNIVKAALKRYTNTPL